MEFLPITRREMLDRGWDACDFVYIIGDAYVDHPILRPRPSSAGFWKATATAWHHLPAGLEKSQIAFRRFRPTPGWAFWSPAAIWTPW